jgi:hypothetical protein
LIQRVRTLRMPTRAILPPASIPFQTRKYRVLVVSTPMSFWSSEAPFLTNSMPHDLIVGMKSSGMKFLSKKAGG